ncbi:hypothetical protein [Nonomuraea salmonea]|uniref:Uncharacterized protein n=1 Tax=Nonomuraea salmonea TaxID=46181 RepID=A0ABV5NFU3_9ACTN
MTVDQPLKREQARMSEPMKAFTEPSGISHLFGVADLEVIEGMFPAETTIWHLGDPYPEWLMTGPNGVTFGLERDVRAYVRYELWGVPPPPPDPSWRTWEGEIFLTSGRIVAVSFFDEADYHTVFDLGRRAAKWPVRISTKAPVNVDDPAFPRDIFRVHLFTLQFWIG